MLKPVEDPRFTYADYRRWTDTGHLELIDGRVVYPRGLPRPEGMSPAPSRVHQRLVLRLAAQIDAELSGDGSGCEVNIAPFDVLLPESTDDVSADLAGGNLDETTLDETIITVVQPDLFVVCDRPKLDDAGCVGAPDWIIEILSPSTSKHDQLVKRDLYERHRVLEYWMVDPEGRRLAVLRLDPATGRYRTVSQGRARGMTRSRVACARGQITIDWRSAFDD